MKVSKSLYSSETASNAFEGKHNPGSKIQLGPEVRNLSFDFDPSRPWHYLFVHHARVSDLENRLRGVGDFNVFIHRSVVYSRDRKKLEKNERPTISGLVFIQGERLAIQQFLDKNFPGVRLVHDCSTKEVAVIPGCQMRDFIRISELGYAHSLRFLLHPFDYYSAGHVMVRVTSGILKGVEGYVVRISRDKSLVIALGNMTVAVGGISKESFENADEYLGHPGRTEFHFGSASVNDLIKQPVSHI